MIWMEICYLLEKGQSFTMLSDGKLEHSFF